MTSKDISVARIELARDSNKICWSLNILYIYSTKGLKMFLLYEECYLLTD